MSWRSRIFARLRGHQTIEQLRRAGLRVTPPTFMAARTIIDTGFAWAIEIGADCIISSDVRILSHDAAIKLITGYTEVRPVTIGDRCYIGAGAIILPGAKIGDDSIIGAGALVRGEIPSGSVAVGNPARVIATVDELRERHLEQMKSIPPVEAYPQDFTPEQLATAQRTLRERGRVYVM